MPKPTKTYPDQTFEHAARAAGVSVHVLWEERGPIRTSIDWIAAYNVNGRPVIVQTYTDSNGWNVFTSLESNDADASIADALARCGVTPKPAPEPMVYTLTIEHRHGAETRVFRNVESAQAALAAWAREWWPQEVSDGWAISLETFAALSDEDAIFEYFNLMNGRESYSLDSATLEG